MAAAAQFRSCYSLAVLADSPVSHWRLAETSGTGAVDDRGANPGTYTGDVTLGQPGAIADATKAARFNGSATTGHVSIADSSSLDVGDAFTYEAWIKRSVTGDPIRYTVAQLDAGRLARFRFLAPDGLHGDHWSEVVRSGVLRARR